MNFIKKSIKIGLIVLLLAQNLTFLSINSAKAVAEANLHVDSASYTWDKIGLDSNNVAVGPNHFLVQVRVSSANAEAKNVFATANIQAGGSPFIHLVTSAPQNLGNIAAGTYKDAFFVIGIDRNSSAFDTQATIIFSADGDNTTRQTSQRTVTVKRLLSQSRNKIVSSTYSDSSPKIGDTFTLTINSETASGCFDNLATYPAYDPSILQLLKVVTTYNKGEDSGKCQESTENDIWTKDHGNLIQSVLTFKALDSGTSAMFYLILDQSGQSFHYSDDFGDVSPVTVAPNLSLVKSVDKATAQPGDVLNYSLTYSNKGNSSATGTIVSDVLDGQGQNYLTYVAASGGIYSSELNKITFNIGEVPAGTSATVSFQAQINPEMPVGTTQITNSASILSNELDPIVSNEVTTVVIAQVDLTLEKSDLADPVAAGANITYNLHYANIGNALSTNTSITDSLPSNLTFVSASNSGTYDTNSHQIIWDLGNLSSGASGDLTLVVATDGNAVDQSAVLNSAEISSDQDSTSDNEQTTLIKPILVIEKYVNAALAVPGNILDYTIRYKNIGTLSAQNVLITDQPDGNLENLTIQNGGFLNGVIINWLIGEVQPGQDWLTVVFSGQIKNPLDNGTVIKNGGLIQAGNAASVQSNEVRTIVASAPILTIQKRVDKTQTDPNSEVTYTIAVSNTGNMNANNLEIVDHWTESVAGLASIITGSFSQNVVIDEQNQTFSWQISELKAGEEKVLTYKVKFAANLNDSGDQFLTNQACLIQSETCADIVTVVVPYNPEITIKKSANVAKILIGQEVEYKLIISNSGTASANGVLVKDVLPLGLSYLDGSSILNNNSISDPQINGQSLVWPVGDLASGEIKTLIFKVKVSNSSALGTKTNKAFAWAGNHEEVSSSNEILVYKNLVIKNIPKKILGVATTQLPQTGATNLGWSFLTIILFLVVLAGINSTSLWKYLKSK